MPIKSRSKHQQHLLKADGNGKVVSPFKHILPFNFRMWFVDAFFRFINFELPLSKCKFIATNVAFGQNLDNLF